MAAVLAGLGGRAVTTAAAHEDTMTSGRYAQLVARGQVPDLLSGEPGPAFGQAAITAEAAAWDDIGLGAITDFVQQASGPVELDRSLVELAAAAAPLPGCPACAGRRFKFPADLAESRDRMCLTHQKEADAVIRRRLARKRHNHSGVIIAPHPPSSRRRAAGSCRWWCTRCCRWSVRRSRRPGRHRPRPGRCSR